MEKTKKSKLLPIVLIAIGWLTLLILLLTAVFYQGSTSIWLAFLIIVVPLISLSCEMWGSFVIVGKREENQIFWAGQLLCYFILGIPIIKGILDLMILD